MYRMSSADPYLFCVCIPGSGDSHKKATEREREREEREREREREENENERGGGRGRWRWVGGGSIVFKIRFVCVVFMHSCLEFRNCPYPASFLFTWRRH